MTNSKSGYGSYSTERVANHMGFIDEGSDDEEDRNFSFCRSAPCFLLSDKSLLEQINSSQHLENNREIILSTSKANKGPTLNVESTSDSVFFEDLWDSDLSDIEDNKENDGGFDKLDLLNLRSFSFQRPPGFEKSRSLPHHRISTPRKRKYSSTQCEVEKRLCAMLDKDDDGDIEENYLDTIWSCKNQTFYPQCAVVLKPDNVVSSPLCTHDNYQLIQESPSMRLPLIGIDHDFNQHHKAYQHTPLQHHTTEPQTQSLFNPPSCLPTARLEPLPWEGRETYRDKLLEGIEQARQQTIPKKPIITSAPKPPPPVDWKATHQAFHTKVTAPESDDGSSVDRCREVGEEAKRVVGNGRVVHGLDWQDSDSDGGRVKISHNGLLASQAGKNNKGIKKQQDLKSKRDKGMQEEEEEEEVLKKKSIQTTKETKAPKKEQQTKKEGKEQSNKQATKKPPPSEATHPPNGYLDPKESHLTKLRVKVDPPTPSKRLQKVPYGDKGHYFSSDDEGIFTSPLLSPQNAHHTATSTTGHRNKRSKRSKKSKAYASSSDGDSVDCFSRSQTPDEGWKKPSRNFDEILWRPALSMGIILITGILLFCFKDKIPFMLSSKFPFQKSSI